MTRISVGTLLSGIGLGVVISLSLTLNASGGACDPVSAGNACSASEHYLLTQSGLNPISGESSAANREVAQPRLPTAGALTYSDYTQIETQARTLLDHNVRFRADISPYHTGQNSFDQLIRQFDTGQGWNATDPVTNMTLAQSVAQADAQLRQARDLYAYLAVYADESRFRSDPIYLHLSDPHSPSITPCPPQRSDDDPTVDPPKVDWCYFAARMRQSVREAAYLHLIFAEQFSVDALGLHFSTNQLSGGEAFVRQEVRQLNQALDEYQKAERVLTEGLHIALGSGCLVSDFYTQSEWTLVSRAVEGRERAQHEVAMRLSYLGVQNTAQAQTAAQPSYRTASIEQYVNLIGTAGVASAQHCTAPSATRPDGDMVAKMVTDMLDTRQHARDLSGGRNVFGFDVSFTPARPYHTQGNDTGLWDQAMQEANTALTLQHDTHEAERDFDNSTQQLKQALINVKSNYDTRLLQLSGCSRNDLGSDEAFWACVDAATAALEHCDVASDGYDACIQQPNVPTAGLLRQSWDDLRTAYLRVKRVKLSIDDIPRKIDIEVGRNATINNEITTNGQDQAFWTYGEAAASALSISTGYPSGVSVSTQPLWPLAAYARQQGRLREIEKETHINNANSEAVVRNLLLELDELIDDLQIAAQEANAHMTQFQTLAAEAKDLKIEARRARDYTVTQNPANDPGLRLVRDSARLQLASALDLAARTSYMAAKRAEYEYAASLSQSNFSLSKIYQARTADDIILFLNQLNDVTNNALVHGTLQQTPVNISVAQHLLGLTDQNLGLTGQAAQAERVRRFRAWVADHTSRQPNGIGQLKPVLTFDFSTSIASNGVFSNVILQGYESYWLHQVAGVGLPVANTNGLTVNLVSEERANLGYRVVNVNEAGLLHLRAQNGCIFEYRLISPAALLGQYWPSNQNPEAATSVFNASINNAGGQSTPAFLARPLSATDWQVTVYSGAPTAGYPDMDLQQLDDIQLNFSTTYASRTPGDPQPQDCVRVDF